MSAEGGDLDDLPSEAHVYDTKAPADDAGVAEQCMHGFRCCIGGDIKVFRVPAEQQVANGAAHQVGLVATAAQACHDLERAVADVFAGYIVLIPGNDIQTLLSPCL